MGNFHGVLPGMEFAVDAEIILEMLKSIWQIKSK
jgi:hypothetical protein